MEHRDEEWFTLSIKSFTSVKPFMVQGKDGHSGVMLVRRNENDYRLCYTLAFIIMP